MNNESSFDELRSVSLGVGLLYVILSSLFFSIYIPTILVMWSDKELMSKPVYNLLVWDCLSDLVQVLGVGFVGGFMSIAYSTVKIEFN